MQLTQQQKIALIGAAAIIAIVLGVAILSQPPPGETPITPEEFSKTIYYAPSYGIFIDLRGTSDTALRQKLQQCGVNLAGSTLLARKSLTIASCDDKSCVSTTVGSNSTTNSTPAQILSSLSSGVYFHVRGAQSDSSTFYKSRVEILMSPSSNFSCKIGLLEEPANATGQ